MNLFFTVPNKRALSSKLKNILNILPLLMVLSLFVLPIAQANKLEATFIDADVVDQQLLREATAIDDTTSFNVFTHGRPGELLINGQWMSAPQIARFLRPTLNATNGSLQRVNLYGCEFAKGKKGRDAVAYLESVLAVQINASTNITGAGGDWILETGDSQAAISVDNYPHSLADTDGDQVDDEFDLDDDNDGVLDTAECPLVASSLAWQGAGFTDAGLRQAGGQTVSLATATGDSRVPGTITVEYSSTNPSDSSPLVGNSATSPWLGIVNTPGYTQTLKITLSEALRGSLQAVYDPNFVDGERIDFSSPGALISPLVADTIGDDIVTTVGVNNPVTSNDIGGQHRYPVRWEAGDRRTVHLTVGVAAGGTITPAANGFLLRMQYLPNCDTDGDGKNDDLDLDSDNDGISDLVEAGGLGVNAISATAAAYPSGQYPNNAVSAEGIPSPANGGAGYTRGTGVNLDSDGDGIPDAIEAQPTSPYSSIDEAAAAASTSGIDQLYTPEDSDSDGTPDYLDTDSDDDGATDDAETQNTIAFTYASTDGGVAPNTLTNGPGDTSEVAYREELDSDGDGVSDTSDLCPGHADSDDFDGDGVPNGCDLDDDNDGVTDVAECGSVKTRLTLGDIGVDSNQAGATHTEDISHLWNIPTGSIILEVANFNSNATGYYTRQASQPTLTFSGTTPVYVDIHHRLALNAGESEGITSSDAFSFVSQLEPQFTHTVSGADYRVTNSAGSTDTSNNDFGSFIWESNDPITNPVQVTTSATNNSGYIIWVYPVYCPDTDGDGTLDSFDLDSDNDGISDLVEAGGLDVNTIVTTAAAYPSGQYPNNAVSAEGIPSPANGGAGYTRGTGVNLDSDGDGIPDAIEAQPTSPYSSIDEAAAAASTSGIDQLYTPEDSDGDGTPDYLDTDSDDDGATDDAETQNTIAFTYASTDGGVAPNTLTNGSGDTTEVAYREGLDGDSDGDGVPDTSDQCAGYADSDDFDGDGVPDGCDLDDDNDGILDVSEYDCQAVAYVSPDSATHNSVTADVFLSPRELLKTYDDNLGTFGGSKAGSGTTEIIGTVSYSYSGLVNGVTELQIYNNGGGNLGDAGAIGSIANITIFGEGGVVLYTQDNVAIPNGAAPFTLSLPSSLDGVKGFSFTDITSTPTGNEVVWRDVYLKGSTCTALDTDGDGIENHLDLDSDGDSCPDALDGGGSFTLANLVASTIDGGNTGRGYTGSAVSVQDNLGNTVDANGLPIVSPAAAAAPQTVGDSQDVTVQSDACDMSDGLCFGANVNLLDNLNDVAFSVYSLSSDTDYTQLQTVQGQPSPLAPETFINAYDAAGGRGIFSFDYTNPKTIPVDANGQLTITFHQYDNIAGSSGGYVSTVRNIKVHTTDQGTLSATWVISNAQQTILDAGGWVEQTVSFPVTPSEFIEITGLEVDMEANAGGTASTTFFPSESEVYALAIEPIYGCNDNIEPIDPGVGISGHVYIDANSSATKESGESGIGGTVVILRDKTSGLCRSVSTSASGDYLFSGVLDGDYEIYQAHGETRPTPQSCDNTLAKNPVGYQSTTPDLLDITVAGADVIDQDFGEVAGANSGSAGNTGAGIAFYPDNQGDILPGTSTVYAHTLTAEADGSVAFTAAGSGNVTDGWTHTLYRDTNCDGVLNGTEGDAPINGMNFGITAGSKLCIINKVYASASVPVQDLYKVDIAATFTFPDRTTGPVTPPIILNVTDLTVAGQSNSGSRLVLTKTVENLTQGTGEASTSNQAKPGDVLKYRIKYSNTGTGPITDLTVNDTVPAWTSFFGMGGACDVIPAGMTCASMGNVEAVSWAFTGTLIGGASGIVSYEVEVDN